MILLIGLISGVVYWIIFFIRKKVPDLKYIIKYRVLKKKVKDDDITFLKRYDKNIPKKDMMFLLLKVEKVSFERAKELVYLYNNIIMKGGVR